MRKFLAGFVSCLAFLGYVGVCDAVLKGTGLSTGGGAFAGTVTIADGAACATPSLGFTSAPTYGWAMAASNVYTCINGTQAVAAGASSFFTANSITIGSGGINSTPAIIASDGSNILALKNANTAQEFRVYAGNGGFISNVKTVTESLTIAAAATTASATTIPAGAILLAVSVRVTTVIPTAATFTVTTTTGGTTLNTAAVAVAANSTDPGTAAGASYRAAATTVTITPSSTPGAATGVVRLQFYYLQVTPPTS